MAKNSNFSVSVGHPYPYLAVSSCAGSLHLPTTRSRDSELTDYLDVQPTYSSVSILRVTLSSYLCSPPLRSAQPGWKRDACSLPQCAPLRRDEYSRSSSLQLSSFLSPLCMHSCVTFPLWRCAGRSGSLWGACRGVSDGPAAFQGVPLCSQLATNTSGRWLHVYGPERARFGDFPAPPLLLRGVGSGPSSPSADGPSNTSAAQPPRTSWV
jgi:hypothetical protein